MRIGRHAGWRRALLLLSTLPLLIEAQSAYDFETQPIQPSFSPRGYQPPPQPARYPVPAPAPRFQPHQSVGYQPPPQPAQYETNNDRYPQHYYRPVTPQRPAPASQYHQEPAQQSYEAVPVQQQPHRPAPAYHQATRPAYEQPQATAAYRVPEPARPAPQYHPAPAYESVPEQPRPTASRPAPPYHPAPAYESVPEQPQPVPRRPAPAYHPEPARPAYESTAQQPAPHRPASQPPPPVHYRPATPSYHHEPAPPSYEPEPQQPRPTVHRPASAHHPEPARPSYEPEPYDTLPIPYEPAPHQPQQQRPTGLPRQPPAIAPMGTFGPAPGTQPGGDGEGLNVMIHVFINEKQRQGVTTQAPGPAAPPHPLPPHLAGMHFPHSSMPLTFTRDFDRTKNRFLADDEEEEEQEGPANIVEIKAVVDSSDAAMDMRIGKAMAKELDRAVPVILGKLPDKTSRLDEGLRNQLEQELISEISKNLGGHLEQNTDVTEKELSDLIDQGFKELEEDSTPQHTPATHPVRLETTTRPAAAAPAHMTTLQPVQPSRPATTAATTRPSAPPATSASASPAATTETQQPQTRPSATPGAPAPASRAPSPPASSTATAGQSTAAATERPTQQQPTAPAATTAPTQPTAPPATVQWWLPTTAAPAEEAAAPAAAQQHATAPSTTAPVPPVATMRTFPTEALPLPVTQPTLKVPESEEEKSGEINEMPFHHQGEEFPTEQPAQPMHESTSTSNQATTVPGTRPVPSVTTKTPTPSTQPTEPTTLPGTRPVPTTQPTEETTMPGTRPAATQPTAAHEKEETVPSAPPDINVETTMPASSTESSMESAQATTLPGTTVTEPSTVPSTAPGTASESMPASKPAEVTTEATTESSASSVPVSATTEPSGTKSTTEPSGTQAPVTKTKEEEEADEVSLDDLISAIEDGLNDEEKKKLLDASKEKSAEETTTTTTGETTTATTSSSATKSELEKELEHELSKELEETSELADELSKTLSKELKSEESTTSSELTDTLSKTLSKELGKSEESVKSSEVSDALSKTLSKELEKSEETTVTSSELADELSKTISKELEKSEETELEKALSTELEKNIEEGKSIETLIHEGEEAFEKLEKEKATEKPEVTKKPEVETSTTVIAPTKEFNHEEMPFEGKDVFGTMNETVKAKEEEKKPTSECSMARDLSDTTKADVLFLLDSSNTFNQEKFRGALELIANTTEHFKNIGPDGVQVSLIQFASEPQLEFSLRRHNCLPTLIEDIKGTEHLKGASMLGHAIDKATRLAFTRERGDRPDAENLLIVVTDGVTEDKVQHPVTVAKENGVGVLVISTIEADPDVVLELAGTADNVFKMDGKITEPLSSRLAQRIRTTAASYHIPEQRFPVINGNMDESAEAKNKGEEEGAKKPIEEGASTTELPSTIKSGEVTQEMLPPPKNLKLQCTRKSLGINIELPGSFHGWLFIEGQREKENCSMKVEKEEGKTFRPVHFEAGIEECDIAHIQSDQPAGINSSAVVSIVKHPKAVSIDDKAYLLECFVASALETTLDAHLEVVGGIKKTIAEAFSLDVVPPKCHYTIRKGSPEGVEVEKADLGEVVFHRWDCDGGDEAYDVFGMHIHDCYASSDVEQQFPILDSNGCSSNTNLLSPPVYADGALSVYAESRAFAVENDQQDLKFQCKVSLCTRDGDGCEGITPPHCSGNATDLLVSRRLRHNQAVDSALTSAVATSVGLTTAAVSRYSPGLVVLIAIILATAIGLISAVRLKSCRTRRASRPIVTSPSMEDIYVTVPGRAPIRTTITPRHPAMTDFMKDFDRSRYV